MSTAVLLSTPETDSPPADPRRWLALVIIATAQLMIVLDTSVITIASSLSPSVPSTSRRPIDSGRSPLTPLVLPGSSFLEVGWPTSWVVDACSWWA